MINNTVGELADLIGAEVVQDGVTGTIVPIDQEQDGTGTPKDADKYVADLAAALTELLRNPELAKEYGQAGRERVEREFTWTQIGAQTLELYRSILAD